MLLQNCERLTSKEMFVAETPPYKQNHSLLQTRFLYVIGYSTNSPDVITGTPQIPKNGKASAIFIAKFVAETPTHEQTHSALQRTNEAIHNSTYSPEVIIESPTIPKKVKGSGISKAKLFTGTPSKKQYHSVLQNDKNMSVDLTNSPEVFVGTPQSTKRVESYLDTTTCQPNNSALQKKYRYGIDHSTNSPDLITGTPHIPKKVKESATKEEFVAETPVYKKNHSVLKRSKLFINNLTNSPEVFGDSPLITRKVRGSTISKIKFVPETPSQKQNFSALQRMKTTIDSLNNSPEVITETPQIAKKVTGLLSKGKFVAETPPHKQNHSVSKRRYRKVIDFSTNSPNVIAGTPQVRKIAKGPEIFVAKFLAVTPSYKQNSSGPRNIRDAVYNLKHPSDLNAKSPQTPKIVKGSATKAMFVAETPAHKQNNLALKRGKKASNSLSNSPKVIEESPLIRKKVKNFYDNGCQGNAQKH